MGNLIRLYWIPAAAALGLAVSFLSGWAAWPLVAVILSGGLPLLWRTGQEMLGGRFNVELEENNWHQFIEAILLWKSQISS